MHAPIMHSVCMACKEAHTHTHAYAHTHTHTHACARACTACKQLVCQKGSYPCMAGGEITEIGLKSFLICSGLHEVILSHLKKIDVLNNCFRNCTMWTATTLYVCAFVCIGKCNTVCICSHARLGYSTLFVAMHAKYCVYIVR